jgi:hypothetical protein
MRLQTTAQGQKSHAPYQGKPVWFGLAAILFFRFIKGGMNLIDLLGILPYFVSLSLDLVTTTARFDTPTLHMKGW